MPRHGGDCSSATRFVAFGVAPPAAFGAAVIADVVGIRPTFVASAVIAGLAFLYLLFSPFRRFRHLSP